IELAMAAKILEARLPQAQQLPGDNPIQGRMRARKVGRSLQKAADGATSAAKGAVATYGAFTREYADLMRPRPQRPTSTNPFKFGEAVPEMATNKDAQQQQEDRLNSGSSASGMSAWLWHRAKPYTPPWIVTGVVGAAGAGAHELWGG